ncbi:hypothetical protein M9Y10_012529 [Tritrichomonas musculus]|uniref:Uncharacterized protein n=1 Tax=Tritrichomonas musculus TaxID=1915356 RepID=A0ABR2GIV4_9EUKA
MKYIKNAVRGLAEALCILKKDSEGTRATEHDTECNKQEDNKLAAHATATKIKCISNCYMHASGIIDVVTQPNVPAKEIVEFGQESIECIR